MHTGNQIHEIRRGLKKLFGDDRARRLNVKGQSIKDGRDALGLTGNQLAEDVGATQSMISRLETGETQSANSDLLFAIADRLNLRLWEIAFTEMIDWGYIRSRIQPLSSIRTLLRPKEWTDLSTIYYPPTFCKFSNDTEEFFSVGSVDDFSSNLNVIVGIAGQGKSTLLKWLCLNEAEREAKVPVLIELRKLDGRAVWDYMVTALNSLLLCDFESDPSNISRAVLFLDAFDEVLVEDRTTIQNEILDIHRTYPNLKILITSRPYSGIDGPEFTEHRIVGLRRDEVLPVIQKYATESEAEAISVRVDDGFTKLANALNTPLFCVLLVLHFRYSNTIPQTTIAFYKDLLDVLISRHNRSEAGLKRASVAGLDDAELAEVFEAHAFVVSREYGDAPLQRRDMQNCMAIASRNLLQRPCLQPGLALRDIIEITNLITDENGICTYLHRSIREYHAATFLARASDEEMAVFYSRVLSKWKSWSGVLDFLEQLDYRRFTKMFSVPDIERNGKLTNETIVGSYRNIMFEKVNETAIRIWFIGSNTRTFDQFKPEAVVSSTNLFALIKSLFGGRTAIMFALFSSNQKTVISGYAKGSKDLPDIREFLSICQGLQIDHIRKAVEELLNQASGFQPRESEFDI